MLFFVCVVCVSTVYWYIFCLNKYCECEKNTQKLLKKHIFYWTKDRNTSKLQTKIYSFFKLLNIKRNVC